MAASLQRAKQTFPQKLFTPVDIDLLVYFRIAFGATMLFWVAHAFASGIVHAYYVLPRLHFHYDGFGWVQPWPDDWMPLHFQILGISSALICAGCCYRLATLIFAVGFTHLFLIDKSLYQNHYYLICLVAWLMVFLPAHRDFSIDAILRPKFRRHGAPAWTLWILRFQIGIPYFFGGVAKLNSDWFAGEPMRIMLAERTWYPGLGALFQEEWFVQLFNWGGLLFDLLVVPALLFRPTRAVAFGLAFMFHVMNATLFTIGIFPWFMILATVVFFDPGSIRKLFSPRTSEHVLDKPAESHSRLVAPLLLGFVLLQSIVPLRHFVLPGNPSWTEEGHYFSWHMMLRGKVPAVRYTATDPKTGRSGAIPLQQYVTAHQMKRFARDPRMIHELARIIAKDLHDLGFENVEIRVLALVSMNGRKPQLMIDPQVDLAAQPVTWKTPAWIVPLTEPLRKEPWDVPILEWEEILASQDIRED